MLHALVREQRVARTLYTLECNAMPLADKLETTETLKTLARQSGLRSVNTLNTTCANVFGIELERLMPATAVASCATGRAGSATSTG